MYDEAKQGAVVVAPLAAKATGKSKGKAPVGKAKAKRKAKGPPENWSGYGCYKCRYRDTGTVCDNAQCSKRD